MGKIYSLEEAMQQPRGQIKSWLYNTLDVTGTLEIAQTLLPMLKPHSQMTYDFERAQQAPAMSMMVRGIKVDVPLRNKMIKELEKELAKDLIAIGEMPVIKNIWDGTELETGICPANTGKHHKWPRGVPDEKRSCDLCHTPRIKPTLFNPNSNHQGRHLFYDLLKIPSMMNKKREISVDEDTLRRLGQKYPQHREITDKILDARNKEKQLGSLNAKLTATNRYTSTFNVGTAWTARWSSSQSPFKQGGNLQNVAERHRQMFIADPGYDIAYVDKMQAESKVVAYVSGDEAYIKAHNDGDPHTFVARLVWPDHDWTGDLKKDKKLAKGINPTWDPAPGHDIRFQSKRIQHGSNFGLTPQGIAMIAKIPLKEARTAQAKYYNAFPGIPDFQSYIIQKVANHEPIVNPLGYSVLLTGRPWDGHTQKQGLSLIPQSTVAFLLNLAMLIVWDEFDPHSAQLLAQVHDALLMQYLTGRLDILKRFATAMSIPLPVTDYKGVTREMKIEVEAAYGKNWGHFNDDPKRGRINLDGLKEL